MAENSRRVAELAEERSDGAGPIRRYSLNFAKSDLLSTQGLVADSAKPAGSAVTKGVTS
jgi:hypothetical protein